LSISVGVLNLLPVPMLDGGQIVYHLARSAAQRLGWSARTLVTDRMDRVWTSVGISFVLLLTVLAFYTDFKRLFGF
jgi:regulator of sigma E protease